MSFLTNLLIRKAKEEIVKGAVKKMTETKKPDLVVQPTLMPMRKVWAAMIAGAVVGAIQSGLLVWWPDHPFAPLLEQTDIWIQTAVMLLAAYFTRNRATG